ncbi:tetratricopeptide repeat protein [Porticoccaceae bacterium LTM1]|nr:tetratricopeptide repeat protein [Porticoccaceae bacterium LTM1]
MFKFKKTILAVSVSAALFGQVALAAVTEKDIQSAISNVGGIASEQIDALYNKSIIEEMDIEKTIKLLTRYGSESKHGKSTRANAYLTAAHMEWRYGRPDNALKFADQALGLNKSADGLLLKARLLDAKGQAGDAAKIYQQAFAKTTSPEEKEFIQIRLTMIDSADNADALIKLAGKRDQEFKNRAAVVLALLGYQQEAIELYGVEENAAKPYLQHIRLADWAIKGKDYDLAQQQAWQAYQTAGASYNARYAIAVLLESYREAEKLADAEKLLAKHHDDPELQQAHIDVLIELNRYDDAITLFKKANAEEMDVTLRQRLLQLYLSANRPDDMVAEYRQLIKEEPHQSSWYKGLASHFMNIGEPEQAKQVWTQLNNNNQQHIFTLIEGAEAMINMGMRDQAMAMVEAHKADKEAYVAAHMFLFEAHLDAAENDAATQTLEQLVAMLPERSAELKDVADAYERLGRPEKALAIFEDLSKTAGGLGYDERMRMAWLNSVNNNKAKALELYQQLWVDVASPARRSFIEAQMLLTAAELNSLGDMVVGLEDKLFAGTANKNDIDLLVRIYVEANDQFSAIDVIDEYSRRNNLPEVERLNQLSRIYMILEDFDAYDKVLRKLAEAEPEFREDHLRGIILNLLSNNVSLSKEERLVEVNSLIEQLKEVGGEEVSGEFEAGVMSLGGYQDKAIESYRKALAQYPSHADNLLLMADLMKENGRIAEAVAMLQYVAEHADGDNEFVVAIDGIINMIGGRRFGQVLEENVQNTFQWAHRIILERITARKEKFYLYTLLSEIANETRDNKAEFVAVENSLAPADIRRSSILRELITLSTQGYNPTGGARAGDEERKLIYGRRLIGLGQELPPEIYIDLGNSLLAKEDLLGAEKAFDMITDITGMLDTDQIKAEAFLKAGHLDQALAYFNSALNRNLNNLELLGQTAVLRERNNQDQIANNWYWRALENVLREQKTSLKNAVKASPEELMFGRARDTSVTRSYNTHFENLVQGLLITWPKDKSLAEKRVKAIIDMVNKELVTVKKLIAEDHQLPLAQYSRLDHMAKFGRRVAEATDNRKLAETIDRAVLDIFADDKDYAEKIAKFYSQWGAAKQLGMVEKITDRIHPLYSFTQSDSVLERGFKEAKFDKDVTASVRYALLLQDRKAAEDLLVNLVRQGKLIKAFQSGKILLDETGFRRVIGSNLKSDAETKKALFELARQDAKLFEQVETLLGRQLLSGEDLYELSRNATSENGSNPMMRFNYGGQDKFNDLLIQRISTDQYVQYACDKIMVAKPAQFMAAPGMVELKSMFRMSLNETQRNNLLEAGKRYLGTIDFKVDYMKSQVVQLIVLDSDPGNQPLMIQFAQLLDSKLGDDSNLAEAVKLYFSGNKIDSYLKFSANKDQFWMLSYIQYFSNEFADICDETVKKLIDGEAVSKELAKAIYETKYENRFGSKPDDQYSVLKGMIKLFPEESNYRVQVLQFYVRNGQNSEVEKQLHILKNYPNGDGILAKATLVELYKKQGLYTKALTEATSGSINLLTEEGKKELESSIKNAGKNTGRRQYSLAALYQQLKLTDEAGRVRNSQNVVQAAFILQQRGVNGSNGFSELAKLLLNEDYDKARIELRRIWRGFYAPQEGRMSWYRGGHNSLYQALLTAPLEIKEPQDGSSQPGNQAKESTKDESLQNNGKQSKELLVDVLIKAPFVIEELNSYLKALNPEDRRHAHELYLLLARANKEQGVLGNELAKLDTKADRRDLNEHDLNCYLAMMDVAETAVSDDTLDALKEISKNIPAPTDFQSLALAKVFARAGSHKLAKQYFMNLAVNQFSGNDDPYQQQEAFVSLITLLEEAGKLLPKATTEELTVELEKIARLGVDSEDAQVLVDAFALSAVAIASSYQDDDKLLNQIDPGLMENVDLVDGNKQNSSKLIGQILVMLKMQQYDNAWQGMKNLLTNYESINITDNSDSALSNQFVNNQKLLGFAKILGVSVVVNDPRRNPVSGRSIINDSWDQIVGDQEDVWLEVLETGILGALSNSELEQERVADLGLALIEEWQKREQKQKASELINSLSMQMSSNQTIYSTKQWGKLVSVAQKLDVTLSDQVSKYIVANDLISIEKQAELLKGLQERKDSVVALNSAKAMMAGAESLELMVELEKLAKKAGETGYAEQLSGKIREQQSAKEKLEKSA